MLRLMPVELAFVHGGIGVLYACRGVVTGREFMDANELLIAAPEQARKLRFGLVDLHRSEALEVSTDELRVIAEQDYRLAAAGRPGTLVAVIADRTLAYGLARMWEAFAGATEWETKSFRSGTPAEAWIRRRVKEKFGIELAAEPRLVT